MTEPRTPRQRFEDSMVIDFDAWHDGTGYDLGALAAMNEADRTAIESLLLSRAEDDWRDIEALAALDTPAARAALRKAMKSTDPAIRNAVTDYAPDLVSNRQRARSLVEGLETAVIYGGLTQTLDQVEEYHPPSVVDALLRGALHREGEVAVHFAAMLYFVKGKAESSFDWDHRPFFLRFHTEDRAERETVFRELCEHIGVDPARYLAS